MYTRIDAFHLIREKSAYRITVINKIIKISVIYFVSKFNSNREDGSECRDLSNDRVNLKNASQIACLWPCEVKVDFYSKNKIILI